MAFPTSRELETLIEPLTQRHKMDIEHIKAVKAGKKSQIVIALDADSRPTLDELQVVSNEIGELLDAEEENGAFSFGAGYTLEVTTPGVDLPLTAPRHWRRNRGRLVKVNDTNGQSSTWRIGAMNPEETKVVLIEAGKKTPSVQILEVSEMPKSVVEIEFNAPPAAERELSEATFEEAEVAATL